VNTGKLSFVLKFAIGILILLILFHRIGFKEILSSLLLVNPLFFMAILFCLFLSLFVNGYSVWLFLKPHSVPLLSCIKLSTLSWAWGVFTPGRLGELSLIAYLKEFGISTGFSGYIFILTHLIILFFLFVIALIGSYWFLPKESIFFLFFGMLLLLFWCYFLFRSNLINEVMKKRPFNRYEKQFLEFVTHVKQITRYRSELLAFSLMQLIKILLLFYMTKLVFSSLGARVDYFEICIVNSIARIASTIPVSINGLGVREGIQIYMFHRFSDIPMKVVASMGIIFNVIIYVSAFVCVVCLKSRKV